MKEEEQGEGESLGEAQVEGRLAPGAVTASVPAHQMEPKHQATGQWGWNAWWFCITSGVFLLLLLAVQVALAGS